MALKIFALFISSFAVALTGAVMPGPLFTAVVGESARRGPAAGPLFILGHAGLELALFVAVVGGVGPFLALPGVRVATGLIGGLIMTFMAVSMFRSLPGLRLDLEPGEGRAKIVLGGALLSLSNPYWIVWWVTIGLGFIGQGMELGAAGLVAVYAGHILGDLSWYAVLSLLVSKGRRFLTDRRYRVLIGVCAGVLAFFALSFIGQAMVSLFA